MKAKLLSALEAWGTARRASAEAKLTMSMARATLAKQFHEMVTQQDIIDVAWEWIAPAYGVSVAEELSTKGRPVFLHDDPKTLKAASNAMQAFIADMKREGLTVFGSSDKQKAAPRDRALASVQATLKKLSAADRRWVIRNL